MAKIKFADGTVINFNGQPTPQDVEEAYNSVKKQKDSGVPMSTDQQALSNLKAKTATYKGLDAQGDQIIDDTFGTTGVGGVVGSGAKALANAGRGLFSMAADTGDGLLTLANSGVKKLGFEGSNLPEYSSGSETNKYLLDEHRKQDTTAGKVGYAAGSLASMFGGAGLATKGATAAKNATLIGQLGTKAQQLMRAPGVVGSIVRATPEVLAQTAASVGQGAIQKGGGITAGSVATDIALNAGVPLAGKLGVKLWKGLTNSSVSSKLNSAINMGDELEVDRLLKSPEYKNLLVKKGVGILQDGTPDPVQLQAVADKELKDIQTKLLNAGNLASSKRVKLSNLFKEDIDNGATATLVGNLSKKVNPNGGFDAADTIDNLSDYTENIFKNKRITNTLSYLGKQDLPINRVSPDELKKGFLDLIDNNSELNTAAKERGRKLLDTYFNPTEIARIKSGQTSSIELLDGIRRATNEKFVPEQSDANLLIGNKIREVFDNMVKDSATSNLDDTTKGGLMAIREANKFYADAQKAKSIAKAMDNLSIGGRSGLIRLVGGVLATGGSYNPWMFLAGSIASENMANVAKNALTRNMLKTGVSEGMRYGEKNLAKLDELTKNIPKVESKSTILDAITKTKKKPDVRDDIMGILKRK